MRINARRAAHARAIALPPARNGADWSVTSNKTVQDPSLNEKTSLALLSLPLPALAAGLGKAHDMSWLGGTWYGVIAVFGVPALLGILCWTGAHYMIGARHRQERARETRRRPF
ncbi:hypothetical protein Acid7E03_31870 [Acidisoma sp. 7E03]